jgi:hypothetical protein
VIVPEAGKTIGQTITLTAAVRNDFKWLLTTTVVIAAGDVVVIGTAAGVYVATVLVLTTANGGGTTSVLTGTIIQLAAGLQMLILVWLFCGRHPLPLTVKQIRVLVNI